jgi:hypothetical protein
VIDIENELFTKVATVLRDKYTPIFVTGEYVKAPAEFPCVSIVEMDNYTLERTKTSKNVENHANIVYEINVYSNKKTGKKTECKSIFKDIDREMTELGFTRIMRSPVPNMEDLTIYRMVGRYRAVISKKERIYGR